MSMYTPTARTRREEVNLVWKSAETRLELVVQRSPDVTLPHTATDRPIIFRPDVLVISIVRLDKRPRMTIVAAGHRLRANGKGLTRSRADMEWGPEDLGTERVPDWINHIADEVAADRIVVTNAVSV